MTPGAGSPLRRRYNSPTSSAWGKIYTTWQKVRYTHTPTHTLFEHTLLCTWAWQLLSSWQLGSQLCLKKKKKGLISVFFGIVFYFDQNYQKAHIARTLRCSESLWRVAVAQAVNCSSSDYKVGGSLAPAKRSPARNCVTDVWVNVWIATTSYEQVASCKVGYLERSVLVVTLRSEAV